MANSTKEKNDDLRHLANVGDYVNDPVAGTQKIVRKTWNFDDETRPLAEFDFEDSSKSRS
ncbi:hypothetical protein C4J95_0861 [Pseudomonas orientalis]|nr:hypothetical protein C4J96_0852 [Pseudomonas orientalis]AZE98339.1 hypothetical protein C4J95_0861 [Pseudomonas orientalis]